MDFHLRPKFIDPAIQRASLPSTASLIDEANAGGRPQIRHHVLIRSFGDLAGGSGQDSSSLQFALCPAAGRLTPADVQEVGGHHLCQTGKAARH